MKSPLSYRRRKSRWDLSFETSAEHRYKEVKRKAYKSTVEVTSKCQFCGCERIQLKIGSKVLTVHYFRSGMTYKTSPVCWGAKNPV